MSNRLPQMFFGLDWTNPIRDALHPGEPSEELVAVRPHPAGGSVAGLFFARGRWHYSVNPCGGCCSDTDDHMPGYWRGVVHPRCRGFSSRHEAERACLDNLHRDYAEVVMEKIELQKPTPSAV